jgi:hypothetical protein
MLAALLLNIGYVWQARAQDLQVHPVFAGDESVIRKSYEEGRQARKRKKNLHYLLGPWRKDLAKVRMPSSKSWTAPNAVLVTPCLLATLSGYFDEMTYQPAEAGLSKLLETMKGTKDFFVVVVNLYAWPGISDWDHSINRPAKQEDVTDVQFLILVDGKQVIRPIYSDTTSAPQKIEGTIPHLTIDQITVESSISGSIYANGDIASIYASKTSTVYQFDIKRESYTAYAATYFLVFPLLDDKGKPIITADTKKLVFKAVRPTYEHTCVFDLSKIK